MNNLKSNFRDVQDFHRKFGLSGLTTPGLPKLELKALGTRPESPEQFSKFILRMMENLENQIKYGRTDDDVLGGRLQMMLEELREFYLAVGRGELANAADALVDLVYFALGTADLMGLPWEALWNEVHSANMSKVRVESKEESKRLNKLDVKKPEGWKPPDLERILLAVTDVDMLVDPVGS